MDKVRIVLRLGAKDADILLLAKQYNIKELIIQAAKSYLGLSQDRIELPPLQPVEPKVYNLRIAKADNPDVFDLLNKIPDGYRVTAVKLLIRHYTTQCDLRFLSDNIVLPTPPKEQPKQSTKPIVPQTKNNVPNNRDIIPKEPKVNSTQPPITKHSIPTTHNEDDIFSLI